MIDAHSLKDIHNKISRSINKNINEHEVQSSNIDSIDDKFTLRLMTPLTDQKPIKKQVSGSFDSKLIGILFCNPNSALGKNEIVNHLQYFHHRSSIYCDFFCVGYGAYWPDSYYVDQEHVVNIDGIKWLFSDQAFNNIRREFEQISEWRYSGETELILFMVKKQKDTIDFNFDTAITCNLEQMSNDGAFSSVRNFFERIFSFTEKTQGQNIVWDFSDQMGLEQCKNLLFKAVLSFLPENLRNTYNSAKHLAVTNISNK